MARRNETNAFEAVSSAVTRGTLYHGRPVGATRSINGIQTYYVMPPSGSVENAILFFTDAMGVNHEHNRLLADNFAANGYFTVMPDLFRGDCVPVDRPEDWSQTLWYKNHLPSDVEPIIQTVVTEMRKRGVNRIAGVGYSIGAKYLTCFMKNASIRVAFIAHPACIDESDILAIDRPISIAFAGEGCVAPVLREKIEMLLSASGLHYQITLYSDVPHGFAVRHPSGHKYEKFAKEQAFLQAIQWLNFYMKRGGNTWASSSLA